MDLLRGRQTQFYIDIIYGLVFAAAFGAQLDQGNVRIPVATEATGTTAPG